MRNSKDVTLAREQIKADIKKDPIFFLEAIGFEDVVYINNYYQARCAIHGGDNQTAFCLYEDSLVWNCFTRGCHEKHGRGVFDLVMARQGLNLPNSVEFLRCLYKNRKFGREKTKQIPKEKTYSTFYDPEVLNRLGDNNYLIGRGIKESVCREFRCGLASRGAMKNRVVVPVFDINENLVGFTGRIIFDFCDKCEKYHNGNQCRDNYTAAKWKNSKNLKKQRLIFNLHRAIPHIAKKKAVVMVEGPIDVLKLWQVGIRNCVALLGVNINVNQIRMLLSLGRIEKLHLALDSDEAGRTIIEKQAEDKERQNSLYRYFNVNIVDMNGEKDFAKMQDDQLIELAKKQKFF